jgi:maltose/moltooligosaccharide transporter
VAQRSFPWRKTLILGFGFCGISIVWPIFNTFLPPLLEKLGLASIVVGVIMTWDNIINVCLTTDRGETSPRFLAHPHLSTSTP